MALVPVEEALSRLLVGAMVLGEERVPLSAAAGRVLARPVAALRTQPPFDASAMDGYAVRAADVASLPVRLAVNGIAAAGHGFRGRVDPGCAVRIFTGAPLPDGADTILIQENVRRIDDATIEALEPVQAGRHIRRRGLDFEEGEALLEAGAVLDAASLSLAASANHPELPVVRRPIVALIATGDELLAPGAVPGPDQIIASNGYGVAAIAASAGASVLDLGIAPDQSDALAARLREAESAGADIVVTLGGASVGDHDLVHEVLAAAGVTFGFWKIAMRPGKPLMFGRKGDMRFLGLPGNPVASLVCSHLFLKPLLARLGGLPHRTDLRPARLGAAMAANDLRQDYVRASVMETSDGLVATPYPVQDSSMLKLLARSGGLIVRPPFAAAAQAGDRCTVLTIR
jgi:molybdopterin molybdotransferase